MCRRVRFDAANVGYGDLEAHQVADGIKAFKEESSTTARDSSTLGKRGRKMEMVTGRHASKADAREASPEAVDTHGKARRSEHHRHRHSASASGASASHGGQAISKATGGVSDGASTGTSPSPHPVSPGRKHARPQNASAAGEGSDAAADGGRGKRVRRPKKRFGQQDASD